jgi:hypothetical protein
MIHVGFSDGSVLPMLEAAPAVSAPHVATALEDSLEAGGGGHMAQGLHADFMVI